MNELIQQNNDLNDTLKTSQILLKEIEKEILRKHRKGEPVDANAYNEALIAIEMILRQIHENEKLIVEYADRTN